MNKELLESYMKSIEEELEMMKGSNITTQVLKYLNDLMHTYKKLEKFVKHKDKDEHKEDKKDLIKETLVDERMADGLDEIQAYCEYRKMYNKTHKQSDLDMSRDELRHFLKAIEEALSEVEKLSRNDMEERAMVKSSVKSIYQSFN